jgi:hypothetical protein
MSLGQLESQVRVHRLELQLPEATALLALSFLVTDRHDVLVRAGQRVLGLDASVAGLDPVGGARGVERPLAAGGQR